jgi:hypothetical protein
METLLERARRYWGTDENPLRLELTNAITLIQEGNESVLTSAMMSQMLNMARDFVERMMEGAEEEEKVEIFNGFTFEGCEI